MCNHSCYGYRTQSLQDLLDVKFSQLYVGLSLLVYWVKKRNRYQSLFLGTYKKWQPYIQFRNQSNNNSVNLNGWNFNFIGRSKKNRYSKIQSSGIKSFGDPEILFKIPDKLRLAERWSESKTQKEKKFQNWAMRYQTIQNVQEELWCPPHLDLML